LKRSTERSEEESAWLRLVKSMGEVATSIQAVIALVIALVGGAIWLAAEFTDGGDDKPVDPAASIQAGGRLPQNRTLAEQVERKDNLTELTDPNADPSEYDDFYGDVHEVKVRFRGHEGPCRIAWEVYNGETTEPLPAPKIVKPSERCRTDEESFHQDVWVPNPSGRVAPSYFVRFLLLDGEGTELERDRTRRYRLAT
jgi:hypothetical protein